jgi:hypothetical protein
MLILCALGACIQLAAPPAQISATTQHLTPPPTSAKVENIIGPDEFPPNVNPLTGLPVKDPTALEHRPIVVKISNAPPLVRPQAGIGAADLVFEHYAEGGLTRFSAVFYSQAADRVGSIRSARLIDYELVPMYKALLAFSGASTGVEDKINTSDFAKRAYKGVLFGQPYFWRDETIEVPHNLFMNPNALWKKANTDGLQQKPDLHGMAFSAEPPQGSAGVVNAIDLRYRATRILWKYEPKTGLYHRWADGDGHFDANTLRQITADNVVVIYASHDLTDIVESEWQGAKSYSIEIKLWFDGDAILFRDGQHYDARWVRPTRESLISLRTKDGGMLYLKPGNTWFQVVQLPEQQNPQEEWLRVK